MTKEQIEDIFSYHQPKDDQPEKYAQVNESFIELAQRVNAIMPPGPGADNAIRKLADARMAVNAAIALEGRF
jgi:hypothetical protein